MLLFLICYTYFTQESPNTSNNHNFPRRTLVLLKTKPHGEPIKVHGTQKLHEKDILDKLQLFAQEIYSKAYTSFVIRNPKNTNPGSTEPQNSKIFDETKSLNIDVIYLEHNFRYSMQKYVYYGLGNAHNNLCIDASITKCSALSINDTEHFATSLADFVLLFIDKCIFGYDNYKGEKIAKSVLALRAMFAINNPKLLNHLSVIVNDKAKCIPKSEDYANPITFIDKLLKLDGFKLITETFCTDMLSLVHYDSLELNIEQNFLEQTCVSKDSADATIDVLYVNKLIFESENIAIVPYIPEQTKTILSAAAGYAKNIGSQICDIFIEIDFHQYFADSISWIWKFVCFSMVTPEDKLRIFKYHLRAIFALAQTQSLHSLQNYTDNEGGKYKMSITLIRTNSLKINLSPLPESAAMVAFYATHYSLLVRLKCIYEEYFAFCLYREALKIGITCSFYQVTPVEIGNFRRIGLTNIQDKIEKTKFEQIHNEMEECLLKI